MIAELLWRALEGEPAGVQYITALAALITAYAAVRHAAAESARAADHEARLRVLESK